MVRMRFAVLAQVLVVALLVVLGGCGGPPPPVVQSEFVEFTPDQLRQIDSTQQVEYRLQTNDLLKIAFADEKKLSPDPVRVLPDGSITVVGVDRVKVAGLTVSQADSLITAAYSLQFRDPRISVIVLESTGRRVYVLGEVRNPGLVRLPEGGLGPIAAVTMAGGFSEDAHPQSAVLVRVTPTGYLVQNLDLSRFMQVDSSPLASVQLMPYDVIYVPRSKIGNFAYFAKSIFSGLNQLSQIASNIRVFTTYQGGRY